MAHIPFSSWITAGVFFVSALIASVNAVHMYQLSSYQAPGYFRWLKKSSEDVLMGFLPVVFLALSGLWVGEWSPWVASGLLALLAFTCRPKKGAKKPLVFTARAVRLLIALALLLACFAAFFVLFPNRFGYVALAAGHIGSLVLVPFAGLICSPLQKLINRGYILDAKKKLASHPGLTVIGVTGSYGKTSTKYFLTRLLSVRFNVLMTPESYNTPMGIVRTIREKLDGSHSVFVCEMGARHVGDIKEDCDIVRPTHGVITSIGPQHLETFKSMENIIKTKFELIDALPPGGLAFLAAGNEHIRANIPGRNAVLYDVSGDDSLDYRAVNLAVGPQGSSFTVVTRGGESQDFSTALIGRHNVENILAAIAVAHRMGIPLDALAPAVRRLDAVPHRLQLLPKGDGRTIIDDAYNSNPAGAKAALETLSMFDGVKVIITPGMVELGERQDELNREFGRRAASVCDYAALVGIKQTETVAAGLREGGLPEGRGKAFETFEAALGWVMGLDTGGSQMYILLENDLPDQY